MNLRLVTLPGVFRPISDSRFLADVLREQTFPPRASALDLCTGSGILALTAAQRGARSVTAIDVSHRAVATVKLNARRNRLKNVRAIRGDLYEPVAGQRFDAIVSNPPYVPSEDDELPTSGPARAWDAGRDGRLILDRIIAGADEHLRPGGFILVTHSSLLGVERTCADLEDAGLEAECVARRRGPLGPLMSARVETLEAQGLLAPGQRHEDVVIIRGRKPARTSTWTSGAAADGAAAPSAA
jgi:release factor glutamine methyltransferase